MQNFFLGCDWGTSSFRLRLFDVAADEVVAEVVTSEGIAKMYSNWHAQNELNEVDKVVFYKQYLKQQVETLASKSNTIIDQLPVIISGMASSTIGMVDVPYSRVPFALDGGDIVTRRIEASTYFPHQIIIVSGVKTDDDVMRGEETQLLGLMHLLQQESNEPLDGIFILPGTHSKHIQAEDGQMITFRTFMTGELFNVIRSHTILKDSVVDTQLSEFSEAGETAFISGFYAAEKVGLLNGLFAVRTNQVFQKFDKRQNLFYLSGLLIGEELKYLTQEQPQKVILCGGSNLSKFYEIALHQFNLGKKVLVISDSKIDKSAVVGQKLVYEKHFLKS